MAKSKTFPLFRCACGVELQIPSGWDVFRCHVCQHGWRRVRGTWCAGDFVRLDFDTQEA